MSQILFVRHGQSTWNAEGRWQGQADPPLTEAGERQARQAARTLGGFDVLVASPLQRALRTAELLGEELGVGTVEPLADLAERAVGPWTGLTFEEIELNWPGAIQRREWPAGFEDDQALVVRALRAVTDLDARFPDASVLAVTHGGVLHSLERAFERPLGRFSNLSGLWLTVEDGDVRVGDRVWLTERPTGGGRHLPLGGRLPTP